MIKINFIANEVAHEKYARIREFLILIYCVIWIISLFFMYLQYQKKQSIIKSYYSEITKLKLKMEKISPQLLQAVHLYQQRNKHKQKLTKLFDMAIESNFILECLENLARSIPENFWINEIHISAFVNKDDADNKNANVSPKNSMVIKGNLFLDLDIKNSGQVQQFQKTLQKYKPYSLAQSRLDLSNVKVGKIENSFYHNFVIKFVWLNYIL